MKMATRVIVLLLALLCLAGCGKPAAEAPDFQAVYDSMTALTDMPDMVVVPNDKGEFLFGIAPGDCKQEIVAICQDSLLADELWLIEATDQEAADRGAGAEPCAAESGGAGKLSAGAVPGGTAGPTEP